MAVSVRFLVLRITTMRISTQKITLLLSTAAVFLLGFAFSSCTKVCNLGYEGSDCKTAIVTKYIGSFSGQETCAAATDSFLVAFWAPTGDSTKLNIMNLYNTNLICTGNVLANGSIAIPYQNFGNSGFINGDVTLTGGKIRVNYHLKITGLSDVTCSWQQN